MEYQKIINLPENTNNNNNNNKKRQIKTTYKAAVNNDTCGTYNTNNRIKFKIAMLK